VAADGHTKRRILVRSMRYGLWAQPALLVRGSSRRIMTLRFRPAYIRVINRRYLSTAATCSAFPKKTGWIFLCRGRSSPEEQPIKTRQPRSFIRSLTSRSISEHRSSATWRGPWASRPGVAGNRGASRGRKKGAIVPPRPPLTRATWFGGTDGFEAEES